MGKLYAKSRLFSSQYGARRLPVPQGGRIGGFQGGFVANHSDSQPDGQNSATKRADFWKDNRLIYISKSLILRNKFDTPADL